MSHNYAVLGSGRIGIAAAYDLARFGEADGIIMLDQDMDQAIRASKRLTDLLDTDIFTPVQADIKERETMLRLLKDIDTLISCAPYDINLKLTDIAVISGTNMVDLGGHTGIVREQLQRNGMASDNSVTIVPDCGMGPGLNVHLATHGMTLLDEVTDVHIYDGGLPLDPQPPWRYALTFNINGLTNEYFGNAFFIQKGKVTEVPTFSGYEWIMFPEPLGKLEAFVTSGGLSTAPWTFEGQLESLENKTLRYPGHFMTFKAFKDLGLFETDSIVFDGRELVPRDVFHSLLEPHISRPEVRDICAMRVRCFGTKDGDNHTSTVELIDSFDEATGFTAMQRLTGWHASIVAILATKGNIDRGALSIENAVPGTDIVKEAAKRGLKAEEEVQICDD